MLLGKKAGVVTAVFVVISLITQFTLPTIYAGAFWVDALLASVYVIICVSYILFLAGLRGLAKGSESVKYTNALSFFTWTTVIASIVSFPTFFPNLMPLFVLTALSLIFVVLLVVMGIASLKLAPGFSTISRNPWTPKASMWLKISGWLMATVILLPIGALLSLIADYYMWKALSHEVRGGNSAIAE